MTREIDLRRPVLLGALDIAAALGRPAPTAEQIEVIEAPPGPLLVIAGAGSGKTETMAARVVWLIANGFVAPGRVLGLTFTRKAAGELAERITSRLRALMRTGLWVPAADLDGDPLETPVVSTYHAYAGRLVSEHAVRLGREPDSRLLTEAARWQVAAAVVEAYAGDLTAVDRPVTSITEAVVELSGELQEHLVAPAEMGDWIDAFLAELRVPRAPGRLRALPGAEVDRVLAARRALVPLITAYRDALRRRDAMDFADQIALAATLARDVPDVGAAERARYGAVLLDEFQDTSDAQLVLLGALFGGPDGSGIVTAVGDPNQSIYGWRGASTTTLARMPEVFGTPERPARTLSLMTSWRNDAAILEVANEVVRPLRATSLLPVGHLSTRPEAGSGDVAVARVETVEDEASLVARHLASSWWRIPPRPSGQGDVARAGVPSGVTAAVLCRRRSQFPEIVRALRAEGLPVEVVGLGGLLLVPEIVEIVSLLGVVHDPGRGDLLMRLLTGGMCRLGAADIEGLNSWARVLSRRTGIPRGSRDASPDGPLDVVTLAEALDDLPPPAWVSADGASISAVGRERMGWLARTIAAMRRLVGLPLVELVAQAERHTGVDIEVLAEPGRSPAVARAHLDAFADVADAFAGSAERPTLGGFLAWLDAAKERERGLERAEVEPNTEAVQVLTIHAAKGLEWDVVAVPGMVEGILPENGGGDHPAYKAPSSKGWLVGLAGLPYPLRRDRDGLPHLDIRSASDWPELKSELDAFCVRVGAHELAEERRLAYVAFTRARTHLLLTAHVWGEGKRPRTHSRFLDEVVHGEGAAGSGAKNVRRLSWVDAPAPDAVNPREATANIASWPRPRPHRPDLAAAAARVRASIGLLPLDVVSPDSDLASVGSTEASAAMDRWTRQIDALLAERRRAEQPRHGADLPEHLSASELVELAGDPERFLASVRRPMPSFDGGSARRGTAFHAWVEAHYSRAALLDVTELSGSADDLDAAGDGPPHGEHPDELAQMQKLFLASEWADRGPVEVESTIETTIDGIALRARIDAVFVDERGFVVVDWKTGPRPRERDERLRALQLGVYALAYSRIRSDLDAGRVVPVRAAFYYARTGETVFVDEPSREDVARILRQVREREVGGIGAAGAERRMVPRGDG